MDLNKFKSVIVFLVALLRASLGELIKKTAVIMQRMGYDLSCHKCACNARSNIFA